MTITKQSHPAIYEALRLIDYDNGAVNLQGDESDSYAIPEDLEHLIENAETYLSKMSSSCLYEFCRGDSNKAEAMIAYDPGLSDADYLLDELFDLELTAND